MESICTCLLCIGSVESFSLPDLQLRSEVDTSDNSLHNSLQNSGSINQFELSFNLTSLTLASQILLLLLVIYLFGNIRAALLALNSKVNNLSSKYGKRLPGEPSQI